MFDYSTYPINDDDNDEFDLDEEKEAKEEVVSDDAVDQLTDEQINSDVDVDQDDVGDDSDMTTVKTNFNGMKILDHVDIFCCDCYFKLKINDPYKYVNPQSATWLLTDGNMRLPNDRLSRVIQSSRKDNQNHF